MRAHERPRVVVPPDSSPPPAALARGHAPPPLQPLLLLPCHLSHSLPWGHLGARGCHGSGQTRLRRRGGGDLSEIKGCPPPRPRRALARARPAFLPSLLAGRPGLPAARAGQGATVACGNSARLICTAHARPAARAGLSSSPPAVRRRLGRRLRPLFSSLASHAVAHPCAPWVSSSTVRCCCCFRLVRATPSLFVTVSSLPILSYCA